MSLRSAATTLVAVLTLTSVAMAQTTPPAPPAPAPAPPPPSPASPSPAPPSPAPASPAPPSPAPPAVDPPSTAPAPPAPSAPPATPAPSPDATPAAPAAASPEDARKEAEAAFRRGLELLEQDAWQAALAEFLRSRQLFPTRNATNNAAFCLRRLNRFDEALDMYEALLREYPDMDAEKKSAAQKEVADLRGLVGTIDIVGAEPGASIVVDGRPRPDFPLIDPLRVSAGTHTIRLFKEGFRPFETRLDVAGGQTVKVTAKMPALAASGRLRVAERSGQTLDVVIGGAVVGVTPWEGSVPVGDQVVWLAGDADMGTQPARVPVTRGDTTSITLAAERLEAAITIEVKPAAATIRLDQVDVGRGIFEGRLRRGPHQIEVLADGFFPQKRTVDLERGDAQEVSITLERDEDADRWRKPSRFTIDLTGGIAISPGFGGDAGAACEGDCSAGAGVGGVVMLHAGYELGSGLGFGLSGGLLQASQTVEGRAAALSPVGIEEPLAGTTTEELRLRGALVGVHAAMHFFEAFPVRLRLGAGALIGSARDERTGSFTTRAGAAYEAPALASESTAAFVYVAPEASVGVRFAERFEVGAALQVLGLIAASRPSWGDDTEVPALSVPGDGLSRYPADESLVGHMIFVVPGVTARASF